MSKQSNTKKVKEHLLKYSHITSWEAIGLYRETRLASIIHRLKNDYSMNILTVMKKNPKNGKRYAKYYLQSI